MKLVREYINEKFTEGGDPVKDMGIGVIKIMHADYMKDTAAFEIEHLSPGSIMEILKDINEYDSYDIIFYSETNSYCTDELRGKTVMYKRKIYEIPK